MTGINLLPWRDKRRQKERRQFLILLLTSAILSQGLIIARYYYTQSAIHQQVVRNQLLSEKMASLDKALAEIKALTLLREDQTARIQAILHLQWMRNLTVHLFDCLPKVIPSDVTLSKLERRGDKVYLFGYARSSSQVSLFMRRLKAQQGMSNPSLIEIKNTASKDLTGQDFQLGFTLTREVASHVKA
jgi:type IV pilus assembly protein PilN